MNLVYFYIMLSLTILMIILLFIYINKVHCSKASKGCKYYNCNTNIRQDSCNYFTDEAVCNNTTLGCIWTEPQ